MVGSINDDSASKSIIRNLSQANAEKTKSFQRLASGRRINSAADDAAGLAIAEALASDVRTTLQGARNASDAISITDIANGAAAQVEGIRQRQRELAEQSANGTLSDAQREPLNNEFQQLEQEAQRIIATTKFNGVSVFSTTGENTSIQVGIDGSANSTINLNKINPSSSQSFNISTQANALTALDGVKELSQNLSAQRGQLGGVESRINVAQNRARDNAVVFEAAASRIRDVDVATETANLVRSQIRERAGTALLAQANQDKRRVLSLLS